MFVGDFEEVGGFGDVIAEIGVLDEVVADVLAGAHDAGEAELLTGGVVDAGVVVLAESIDIDDRPVRHRGIPLNVLQKILGHKSIETTKGYLHPDLDHIAQAGDLTNRFLDAQTEGPERSSSKGRGKPKRGPDDRGL